jgi:hypothetical protein
MADMTPTEIEKRFIDLQVKEWKNQIYAQRALGIDVDILNTRLAVKHDNGEIWEILIKCKRIAEPVKSGPAGLTTWEKKDEVIPKGQETIDLSGQTPDPAQLPPTSKWSPEKIVEGMEVMEGNRLKINEAAAAALTGHPHQLLGSYHPNCRIDPDFSLLISGVQVPIPFHDLDPTVKPGSAHEAWLKKGLKKYPITDDDIMNTKAGLEAAAPFFDLMDEEGSGKHVHQAPEPWWKRAGYGEM